MIPKGLITIHKAPPRPNRLITFGAQVTIETQKGMAAAMPIPEDVAVKEFEKPQIVPEMPEVMAEVHEVLADDSIYDGINAPPKKKRGRPRKERIDE